MLFQRGQEGGGGGKQALLEQLEDEFDRQEVGLEQVERTVASRAGLMQKALLPRHERRSTIVTSNIPWESWGEYLGDHLGAGALLDRLIHHSHVIVINGPSYRDHEHRKDVKGKRGASSPGPSDARPAAGAADGGGANGAWQRKGRKAKPRK